MEKSYKFSLVICTYMRAKPLLNLLKSVQSQTLYPDEILIIDGSTNDDTKSIFQNHSFPNLIYYQVTQENRGLTKQRNFGIDQVNKKSDVVCFLDDDTVLENDYFQAIINTFKKHTDAIGVGGIALNENKWKFNTNGTIKQSSKYYVFEEYYIKESSRNYLRNILGLNSDCLPAVMPNFSHGRTTSYPITGKAYSVDLLVGMAMNFRRDLFDNIKFSTYFEGYGLYEDADFSLRALQFGKNYIATSAQLNHYHDASGRPNKYNYGKMVIRNGWYVWRVKYPNPSFKALLKWNLTALLLTLIRFSNIITTNKPKEAFTESMGRVVQWFGLIFKKPQIK